MRILLILVLIVSQPVMATTYIVTHLGRTGNVPGDGGTTAGGNGSTLAEAMSLAKAALIASIEPGDTLSLYDDDGSFGDFTLTTSHQFGTAWTAGNYITVSPGTGETATFTKVSWNLATPTQNIYWLFDGIDGRLIIDNGTGQDAKNAVAGTGGAHVILQNCSLLGRYETYSGIVTHCFPKDSPLITFVNASNNQYPVTDIQFLHCSLSRAEAILKANIPSTGITIHGCTITGWGGDLYAGATQSFSLTDNDISGNDWRRNVQCRTTSTGTETGTFTYLDTLTQGTSGATAIVASNASGYTYWHQTSSTNFATNTAVTDHAFTEGNPTTITKAAHGLVNGNKVLFHGVTGDSAALVNDLQFEITKTGDNTFTIPVETAALNDDGSYSKDFIWDNTSGANISGTFTIATIHGDGIQMFHASVGIDGVTVSPNPGDPTRISASTVAYIKTGDQVKIIGLEGADCAFLNDHIFYAKYVDVDDIDLYSDAACTVPVDSNGKTITQAASGDYAIPIIKNTDISRNNFHDMEGNSYIYLQNATFVPAHALLLDGCTIESNRGYGSTLSYGIFLAGVQDCGLGDWKINNNTFTAANSTYGSNQGFYIVVGANYGNTKITKMYNNIFDGVTIQPDSGGYSGVVTAHDYNTYAKKTDTSSHWTDADNETNGACANQAAVTTFLSDYFVNYAGNDYHLKAGSPAIQNGSASGATLDINGVAFGSPPDQGCYSYTASSAIPIFWFIYGD